MTVGAGAASVDLETVVVVVAVAVDDVAAAAWQPAGPPGLPDPVERTFAEAH